MVFTFWKVVEEEEDILSEVLSDETWKSRDDDEGHDDTTTEGSVYECQYNPDCTPLFKALEAAVSPKDFGAVCKFLDTGYWPGAFFEDDLPPQFQAKTWVLKNDAQGRVASRQLPLHMALIKGAPSSVIGRLVKLYPEAVRVADDEAMLPLHLALSHGSDDQVVTYLLMHYPEAVNFKGRDGRTAVQCALEAENKIRGKLLEIFIEESSSNIRQTELARVKKKLDDMRTDYEYMKTIKESMEQDLTSQIDELQVQKLRLEAKIEKLKRQTTRRRAGGEQEESTADEIEQTSSFHKLVERQITKSSTAEDYKVESKFNEEASEVRKDLKSFEDDWKDKDIRWHIKTGSATLTEAIHEEMTNQHEKAAVKQLLRMNKTVEGLSEDKLQGESLEELTKAKGQLEDLEKEFKEFQASTTIRRDMLQLQANLKAEIGLTKARTDNELYVMKRAVDTLKLESRENKSLTKSLTTEIKHSNERRKAALVEMKQTLDAIDFNEIANKNQWNAVRKGLETVRKALKEKQDPGIFKNEEDLIAIKEAVEAFSEKSSMYVDFDALCEDMDKRSTRIAKGEEAVEEQSQTSSKMRLKKFKRRLFRQKRRIAKTRTSSVDSSKPKDIKLGPERSTDASCSSCSEDKKSQTEAQERQKTTLSLEDSHDGERTTSKMLQKVNGEVEIAAVLDGLPVVDYGITSYDDSDYAPPPSVFSDEAHAI